MVECKYCGHQNDSENYFCEKCCRFLLSSEAFTSDISDDSEMKLSRITSNLKENPHFDIVWNAAIDEYARKTERIQSLLHVRDFDIESEGLNEKIDSFLNVCRNPNFEIAFVGAVKAGKSTLINALLDGNYASTDPNPETAVLTKFRSSKQDYVRVSFYSKKEWNSIWKSAQSDSAENYRKEYVDKQAEKYKDQWIDHEDVYKELANSEIEVELKEWSSSQSAMHFFVKEIEVGISSVSDSISSQVVFVDTPGLFDPVGARSQISKDYIQRANAVVVCIEVDDIRNEEMRVIQSVFSMAGRKRDKIFIVATKWDKQNEIICDWYKRREYCAKNFVGEAFFPEEKMAKSNILYASSYLYNICRDYKKIDDYSLEKVNLKGFVEKMQVEIWNCDKKNIPIPPALKALKDISPGSFSAEDLEKIKKSTNIPKIRELIYKEIADKYLEILYEDIKIAYDEIKSKTRVLADEQRKALNELITFSGSSVDDVIERYKEKLKEKEGIKNLQNKLTAYLKTVDKQLSEQLKDVASELGN